jgi:hypothetical protein
LGISRIYISGYREDFRFTCCCIASIRQFYPAIPVTLIKDRINGDYDASQLQRLYNIDIFDTPVRSFGWGMAKLEPLFLPGGERCLVLDSDTVFLGRVLERLDVAAADFVVEGCNHTREDMLQNYFDPSALSLEFPGFHFPGYVFNSGQFVATTGILKRSDFDGLIEFSEPRQPLRPGLFRCGDQGVFDFVLLRKQQQGLLTIARDKFMQWPPSVDPGSIAIPELERAGYPLLLHWAGPKLSILGAHSLGEVLTYFAHKYMRDLARQRRHSRSSFSGDPTPAPL